MNILTIALSIALSIAVLYIVVDRAMVWLTKHGGFTIRIETKDDDE